MDDATVRRLINIACPVALIVTVYDLTQALNHFQDAAIAVTLLMIAAVVVAWLVGLTFTGELFRPVMTNGRS
jgi:predicted permease